MSFADPIVCEQCDWVQQRVPCPRHASVRCGRCGYVLYRDNQRSLDTMLALTAASLVVFLIANLRPLLELEISGKHSTITLWQMILTTSDSNVAVIAVPAALCVFFFPLLQISLYAYVLVPLARGRVPVAFAGAMHGLRQMQPWIMVEVFLLGLLVSVVKLSVLATATPRAGMLGFAVLTGLLTALSAADLRWLWSLADGLQARAGAAA
jgi:paraquat-inducible protein A